MYTSSKYFKAPITKREQIKHKLKYCDRYGRDISFQIGGAIGHGSHINSVCGAITHIAVLVTIFLYSLNRFTKLIQHEDTQFHRNVSAGVIDCFEEFSAEKIGFNAAIGLI